MNTFFAIVMMLPFAAFIALLLGLAIWQTYKVSGGKSVAQAVGGIALLFLIEWMFVKGIELLVK